MSECTRDENGHMLPHDCGQERHTRCYSEPRPDGSDQGRCPVKLMIGQSCCKTPLDCALEPAPAVLAGYPRTCAEAGKYCVDVCTLRGQDMSILDPDCFRGPKGRERLAKWRAERADDEREAAIAAGPQERELPGYPRPAMPYDEPEPSCDCTYATSCSEHRLTTGERGTVIGSAPIQLAQCRFCGGPGHAYGERCGRVLAGRSYNLQSPSARLTKALMDARQLREQMNAFSAVGGAPVTPAELVVLLGTMATAFDAIHEALADLYTGRL